MVTYSDSVDSELIGVCLRCCHTYRAPVVTYSDSVDSELIGVCLRCCHTYRAPVVTYSDSVDSELIGVCLRARLLTECHFVLFKKKMVTVDAVSYFCNAPYEKTNLYVHMRRIRFLLTQFV